MTASKHSQDGTNLDNGASGWLFKKKSTMMHSNMYVKFAVRHFEYESELRGIPLCAVNIFALRW
jgi:hypothetical protein